MARVTKDDLDRFMEHSVHLSTKTIYMGSEHVDVEGDAESGTDASMAARMIKAIHHLDSSTDSSIPLTIIMNNVGGNEYHGMAIYDAIKACKSKTIIKVFGHAMSMGSIILQAADERIMAPNARVMIHYGSWGVCDHPKVTYKWAAEGKKFDRWMMNVYMDKIKEKNPEFSKKKLDKMLDFDTFLDADQAVELGLADAVLE